MSAKRIRPLAAPTPSWTSEAGKKACDRWSKRPRSSADGLFGHHIMGLFAILGASSSKVKAGRSTDQPGIEAGGLARAQNKEAQSAAQEQEEEALHVTGDCQSWSPGRVPRQG